ncbi:DNA mismatch repair protein msh-2 [Zancudomyces culisetae]|uniref:DNA mismatch repair protein msh-2 n=1 Tax=Zancudomyces culisetae TaxID=1213189 RepID=A0A1R1PR40_ZANCU|nr:DNA mismatch repair protein msh-2 [Zancudomyces culisetae]|eukprot:OMH83401.1 DNA mismatch repair protein msh-2 [Zancudomyces culisetae]
MERLGAFCLFATHFHELTTKLVEANSCGANKVCNLHVMAKITGSSISTGTSAGASGNASGNKDVSSSDVEEFLTLLYKIVEGPSDQSFGIQVAKMAGFPESVLDLATKRLVQTTASISNGNDGNDGDDVEMADVDQGADDKEQGVQLIIEFLSSITKDIKSSTMNSNGDDSSGGGAGDKQRVLQIINKHKGAYMPKFSQNRYISQLLCL